MPRLTNAAPRYRRHRASGQAIVTLNGRDFYLGPYGSTASRVDYDRLIGEWLAAGRCLGQSHGNDLTVAELCLAYKRFAKGYYRAPDGSPTGSVDRVLAAIKVLRKNYATTLARDFGPLALQAVQRQMADSGKARSYCNHLTGAIKRMFKWAVSQELIPVDVYQALATVSGLKIGRSPAKEPEPIGPVSDDVVAKTLPHLPEQIVAMIKIQQLTGCRPGEVCIIRPCDVSRNQDVWDYRPKSHKTAYRRQSRVIKLGPKAQEVLLPWLLRDASTYCFSPAERVSSQRRNRGASGEQSRRPSRRKRHPNWTPGKRYTTTTYYNAIRHACVKAGVERWAPNQLRHAVATKIREQFGGLEPVQAVLGHKNMQVSEVYAEKNLNLATEIMRKIG